MGSWKEAVLMGELRVHKQLLQLALYNLVPICLEIPFLVQKLVVPAAVTHKIERKHKY